MIEFFDGFEGTSDGTNQGVKPEWVSAAFNVTSSNPRTGARAAGLGGGTKLGLPATALKTIGFAFSAGNAATTDQRLVTFLGDGRTIRHLTLACDATGHPQLLRGGIVSEGGVVIATASGVYPNAAYRHIQMQATIADSGGRCIVKQDDVTIIDFTGDTRNGGVSTNIDGFEFYTPQGATRWDDMWVTNGTDDTANTGRADNGFLGDLKVEVLYPSGDGALSQWLGSDGNSVQNFLLVDDPGNVNPADYVASSTPGQRDLWTMQDVAGTSLQVFSARACIHALKTDAGARGFKTVVKEAGGTEVVTADQPLSTTGLYYWDAVRNTKLSGGAWTPAVVNGLTLGVETT